MGISSQGLRGRARVVGKRLLGVQVNNFSFLVGWPMSDSCDLECHFLTELRGCAVGHVRHLSVVRAHRGHVAH